MRGAAGETAGQPERGLESYPEGCELYPVDVREHLRTFELWDSKLNAVVLATKSSEFDGEMDKGKATTYVY